MKRTILLLSITFLFARICAQTINVPYLMGFETSDAVELANWVLNAGADAPACRDQWVVGDATRNGGVQSLYISTDGGATAAFGRVPNVQYAYRDFILPQGNYILSFDWRCMGVTPSTAGLYAGVAPKSSVQTIMTATAGAAALPSAILAYAKSLGILNGSGLWRNEHLALSSNGTREVRVFFAWVSANTDTVISPLGACIDNVQICSNSCPIPTHLAAEAFCDSVYVTWESACSLFGLEYKKRDAAQWTVYSSSIDTTAAVIEGLNEGQYDIRVRSFCDADTSAYAYLNAFTLFCPEKHCINYVDLYDSTLVRCTFGTFTNPEANEGVLNFGEEDKYSRHTVNWTPDRYDPRTCNQLPTIPAGELASIRLGNWNNGAEAESIEFFYTADLENAAILLLKYAVVLEDPQHGQSAQPRFSLTILGQDGYPISPTCGEEDFYADASRQDPTWHTCVGAPGASSVVTWKEWTTIGINLAEAGVVDGEQLTIRLTTKDCSASAHFGYAYFTIGCAAARLIGSSCGNESSLTVTAPEGFRYEWYNKFDSLVCTDKRLAVDPSDTTTYHCVLKYLEKEECSFTLHTSVKPRFPIPAFTPYYEPKNCTNRVRFVNRSHIMTVFNGDTVYHEDEPLESYTWDFGTGAAPVSDVNPVYIFPDSGGVYKVTLYGSISSGACIEDTSMVLHIPAVGAKEVPMSQTICENTWYDFGGKKCYETGIYYDSLRTRAGCDSVRILNLTVVPVFDGWVPDTTICSYETLTLSGKTYPMDGTVIPPTAMVAAPEWIRFYQDQFGCDSTVHMHVTVLDSILPIVYMHDVEGEKVNSGYFTLSGSGYSYYAINGEINGPLTGLNGGEFILDFYNDHGCVASDTLQMSYPCLPLIFQRWGDVLSLMNEEAQLAAGLTEVVLYSDYQWFRNGQPIDGATRSYIYVPEGLNPTDAYSVRITTADGRVINTCTYLPELYTGAPAPERMLKVMHKGHLYILHGNRYFDIMGRPVSLSF